LQCLLDPGKGQEVIIPAPAWVSYFPMAQLAGGTVVEIPCTASQGFKMTPEQLEHAITDRTRVLMINSPSNPCGTMYSPDELRELASILERHERIVIIADEIYEKLIFGGLEHLSLGSLPSLAPRVVTINGLSKAYAMTGWRIGYAAGPEELITAMKTIQSQSTSNPCSISQQAAQAALDGDQGPVAEMAAAYRKRHNAVIGALNGIDGFKCRPGDGTFYAFPEVTDALTARGLSSDIELAELLINEADVALVPGSAFGAPGYLRLSFAASLETLEAAIDRIKRVLSA